MVVRELFIIFFQLVKEKQHRKNFSGFTLVEMTVVLVIAGILLGLGLSLAKPYFAEKQKQVTTDSVLNVEQALADHLANFGFYPCPAPLTTPRGTAADGLATDCSVAAVPGVYEVDGRDPGTGIPIKVRIGAVPYRDLEIPANSTIDAQQNRLTYAVSVPSTTLAYNDDPINLANNTGAIDIVDASGTTLLDNPGTAHLFFFSHGRDGKGSYTDAGVLNGTTCVGGIDSENCDFLNAATADATFAALMVEQLGTGGTYYDDITTYSLLVHGNDDDLWDRSDAPNMEDIYNLNTGNVGIGTDEPEAKLHVLGDSVVFERSDKQLFMDPNNTDSDQFSQFKTDLGMGLRFYTGSNAGAGGHAAIVIRDSGENGGNPTTDIEFYTRKNGDATSSERMRITSAGRLGIGKTNPKTALDVAGEIRLSNDGLPPNCNANKEGAMRYNNASKTMEFCNGTIWGAVSSAPLSAGNMGTFNAPLHVFGAMPTTIHLPVPENGRWVANLTFFGNPLAAWPSEIKIEDQHLASLDTDHFVTVTWIGDINDGSIKVSASEIGPMIHVRLISWHATKVQ